MKIKKIIAAVLMTAVCCFSFSSCGEPEVAGDELINKARDEYVELDSAKVLMTNVSTGKVEQTFTFKYDEKDVLTYSYYGKSEKTEVAMYNNSLESASYKDGKYSHAVKGDSGFLKYTRKSPYAQADKGMILFEPKAVTNAKMTEENGVTHVIHIYDTEKIGATSESGEVTGFSVEYFFDKNGELLYFVENTNVKEDGKDKTYSYKVEITEKNSVENVENTVEKFKPKDE